MGRAHLAAFFLRLVKPTEFQSRAPPGFFRSEASGYVIGDLLLQVEAQLGIHLLFRDLPPKETTVPAHGFSFQFSVLTGQMRSDSEFSNRAKSNLVTTSRKTGQNRCN